MAHISRALTQRFLYFKGSTAGLLKTLNGTQKHLCVFSTVFPDHLKHPTQRRALDVVEVDNFKKKIFTKYKNQYEFRTVRLEEALNGSLSEGAVLQVFNKLLNVTEKNLSNPSFKRSLQNFTSSKNFIKFCKELEKNIDRYSLETLLLLYDLEYFNVPQTSSLMTKISKLVLDYLKTANTYQKLLIYGTTLMKPHTEGIRKNIIDECEAYVKHGLYYDLQCRNFSIFLSSLFQIEGLPKHVKLILVEKLTDDIMSNVTNLKFSTDVLYKLACTEDSLIPKETWLNVISCFLNRVSSSSLLKKCCLTYTVLLQKDISYYCPEVMELLVEKFNNSERLFNTLKVGETLCEVGYFSRELLDVVLNGILHTPNHVEKPEAQKSLLSFLAQSSFHEIVPEATAQSVKTLLETKKLFEVIASSQNNSLWCMYLTYIGYDTRVLLSNIFKSDRREDSNLLRLHHLAKAYFPGDYESLSKETVNILVKDEFKKSDLWDPENSIGKCFESEDFVLRNCITSDSHCLHYVTVFQSDRKPMNLAMYSKKSNPKIFFNIDGIEKPQGSKIIAFILYPYKQPIKLLNLPSMSGSAKMYLKSFEGANCNIVLLHKKFFSLSLEDKKKFLESQVDEIFAKSSS